FASYCFCGCATHRYLHPFPTRRSSDLDFPNPIPVPPPSQADTEFIISLGVPTKPVSGVPDLMHHKYIVRDGTTDGATVWTGSMKDRKSTRLHSSHDQMSYAVFRMKKKK